MRLWPKKLPPGKMKASYFLVIIVILQYLCYNMPIHYDWGVIVTKSRLLQTIRLCFIRTAKGRADYIRAKGIFNHMGEDSTYMPRTIPLYANLIRIHNNVHIASDVRFVTHDISHDMLNLKSKREKLNYPVFYKKIGCIEIMDNVYIGAGVTIMNNVRISENVIAAAGCVITKDIPPNSVVAGVPAAVIKSLDEYLQKKMKETSYPRELKATNQICGKELSEWAWNEFSGKGPAAAHGNPDMLLCRLNTRSWSLTLPDNLQSTKSPAFQNAFSKRPKPQGQLRPCGFVIIYLKQRHKQQRRLRRLGAHILTPPNRYSFHYIRQGVTCLEEKAAGSARLL